MKKNRKEQTLKDNESMLAQKTNEDFNKKQPASNDFNENKGEANNKSSIKVKRKK